MLRQIKCTVTVIRNPRDLAKIASRNVLRVMRQVEKIGEKLRATSAPTLGRLEDYPGV